jgi:DNA-binding NarL/FixJ family response regulator
MLTGSIVRMPRPLDRVTVLVTHSDPLISAGLAATLGQRGEFEVVVRGLESSAQSSTVLGRAPVDVAIADYESGLHLIGSLELGRNRVLILTHRDSEAAICHALEQGAGGYLLQGCSVADITGAIRLMRAGDVALGPLVASRIAERMKQQTPLTPREADILRQMMAGLSNKAIALKLDVAVGTVKTHVKSIIRKLAAESRTHAVAVAQRRGILPDERPTLSWHAAGAPTPYSELRHSSAQRSPLRF